VQVPQSVTYGLKGRSFVVKEKVIVLVVFYGEELVPFVLTGVTWNVDQALFIFLEIVVEVAF
jgi:hypothetical protein